MFPEVLPSLMLTLPLLGAAFAILLKGRGAQAGLACAVLAAACGGLWSLEVLLHGTEAYTLPLPSIWGDYAIRLDPLGAMVLLVTSLVIVCIGSFACSSEGPGRPKHSSLFNIFVLSVLAAMVADHVLLLLLAWETMSLSSFLAARGEGEEGARAGWRYLAVTHLGAALVISAFAYLTLATGETRLSAMAGASIGSLATSAVVLTLFLGFGSKLGLLPFHVWMPDLYRQAPSSLTALLSTASSNVAVLVLVRTVFGVADLQGQEGLVLALMALSAMTALWGAWQALVQSDLSSALAFSSMENMGLVLMTVCAGMLFTSFGAGAPAVFALVAALFHLINHTVFKSLLLAGAGAVRRSTGEGDLERLGGLARALPALSALFLVGTLAVAALPPFNGFVSEWAMFKSLMHAETITDPMVRLVLPLAVAVMALSTAIAAAAYLRLFGFTFLGRPRSNGACDPRPADRLEIAPLVPLAVMCLLLGVMALPLLQGISSSVSSLLGTGEVIVVQGSSIDLGRQGGLDPFALSMVLLVAIGAVLLLSLARGRRAPERRDTWDCGAQLDRRTQYSPTAFSQPLLRVFEKVFRPRTEVEEVQRPSPYIRNVRFAQSLPDLFMEKMYAPLTSASFSFAFLVKRMQNGSIQTYLAYLMITLLFLLVVLR